MHCSTFTCCDQDATLYTTENSTSVTFGVDSGRAIGPLCDARDMTAFHKIEDLQVTMRWTAAADFTALFMRKAYSGRRHTFTVPSALAVIISPVSEGWCSVQVMTF